MDDALGRRSTPAARGAVGSSTCREDWAGRAGLDERRSRSRSAAMRTTRRDRRGHDDRRQGRVARRRSPGISPGHLGRAERAAPRRLLHAPASTSRRPTAVHARGRPRPASDERQAGERVLTVPFKPGESADPPQRGAHQRSSPSVHQDAEVHFKRAGTASDSDCAAYPHARPLGLRRRPRDEAHASTRARGRSCKQLKRGRRAARWTTSARVDDLPARPEFRYTERPPQTPADEAPLDYFINVSHAGLLPALRGRDGADAADGRHPGARGHRLHARRLLVAPQGLDRPRHRRPRVGRGVVRQVRLGRRSTRRRTPRPPARRSPRWRPRRRRAPPAPDRDTGARRRRGQRASEPDLRAPGPPARHAATTRPAP